MSTTPVNSPAAAGRVIVLDPRSLLAADALAQVAPAPEAVADARRLRKVLKHGAPPAVLLLVLDGPAEQATATSRLLRQGLRDHCVRIVVLAADGGEEVAQRLVREAGADSWRPLAGLDATALTALVEAERRTWRKLRLQVGRREAEVALMEALAQFSRLSTDAESCYRELAERVAALSGALVTRAVVVDGEDAGGLRLLPGPGAVPEQPLAALCRDAVRSGTTSVRLDPSHASHREMAAALGHDVDGSVVFAVRAGGSTRAVVACLLERSGFDGLSVAQMQLIEKACEQLGVLLERREAEQRLAAQYDRLKQTLGELSTTQSQLFHAEKMASVGQLAAGIAHEINNPLAFVMSNFTPLDDYVGNMTRLLGLHTQFVQALEASDQVQRERLQSSIADASQQVDIGFIMEDVRALVDESRNGLLRVRDIVSSLREFSRSDSTDKEPTDLHRGIESTLTMLRHRLRDGVEVVRDFGDLPLVPCSPGLVNQVFMNVVGNALQAMDGHGELRISTGVEDDHAVVRVRDSGPGIPAHVLPSIFNPFFTTKPAGEGTGLGLSISWNIIERHGGRLGVDTREGEYTEFEVRLPLVSRDEDQQAA